MAKIKHIALSTQDVDRTAAFYVNVFGMKEIARIDSPNARGYYLSDGHVNLAILKFKYDDPATTEGMLRYAVDQKSRQITTGNLLLSLLDREDHDPAAALLNELGVDRTEIRRRVLSA